MGAFNESELATLAQVAETFVRGGGERRAHLAAEAMETSLDPAQVRQLRMVLRAFESRPANLALGAGARGFRDMSDEARERYLLAWGGSRIPQRRSAFAGLRKLLTFLAYADPGEDGRNPLHEAIGYHPTYEPVTSDPTPIRPTVFATPAEVAPLEADVVVVGSGAGGGVVAAALAEAGRSVVVLESGPFVPEPRMPTDEMTAHGTLYLNHGLVSSWDASLVVLAGGAVGGGTTINWMTCVRPPGEILAEWATEHGLEGVDDPAFAADLTAIEEEIEASAAPNVPPKDAALQRGAAALGYPVDAIETNAVGCGDCGTCSFGCRIGAKRSGLRVHLARAVAAGARIVADAPVDRVVMEDGRVRGVEAVVATRDGGSAGLTIRAAQVVVAAGALRSPGVLLRSGLTHPGIGRHLRIHPVAVVGAMFAEPIEMWRWTNQAVRSTFIPGRDDTVQAYTIESAPGHPGIIALAFPWEGRAAHAGLLERIRWWAPYVGFTRDSGSGRISLSRSGRERLDYDLDERGTATLRHALVRMARITRAAGAQRILAAGTPPAWYGRDGLDRDAGERAFRAYEERLARFDFSPNRGLVGSAHQMGSVRAGADARAHPCDQWGRVRRGSRDADGVVEGLYVGDGSLFPTGLGVNPQLTVMAMARRTARTVLAEG